MGSLIKVKAIKGLDEYLTTKLKAINDAITDLKNKASDEHVDEFDVPDGSPQTVFALSKTPIGEVKMFIDGVRYFQPSYSVDVGNKEVTWNDTKAAAGANNGFDIEDNHVVLSYHYDVEGERNAAANGGTSTSDGTSGGTVAGT